MGELDENRIAVISDGPSAKLYPGSHDFNLVIGVNWTWVDLKFPVDWWAWSDFKTYQITEPLGSPGVFTKRAQVEKVNARLRGGKHNWLTFALEQGRVLTHEEVTPPELPQGMVPWNSWTGTAALVLAWHMGGTRIDVYGADMTGNLDAHGRENGSRTNKRWQRERELFKALCTSMARTGTMVCRHRYRQPDEGNGDGAE